MQSEPWDVSFNLKAFLKNGHFQWIFGKLGLRWNGTLGISFSADTALAALAGHILDSPVIPTQMAALKNEKPWKKRKKLPLNWIINNTGVSARIVWN